MNKLVRILESDSAENLEGMVNAKLADGYSLRGNLKTVLRRTSKQKNDAEFNIEVYSYNYIQVVEKL